jgi:hypothetical protein
MQVESPGHKSREAKLIKLVDQTSNLRAISFSQRRIGRSNVVLSTSWRRFAVYRRGQNCNSIDASKHAGESAHPK